MNKGINMATNKRTERGTAPETAIWEDSYAISQGVDAMHKAETHNHQLGKKLNGEKGIRGVIAEKGGNFIYDNEEVRMILEAAGKAHCKKAEKAANGSLTNEPLTKEEIMEQIRTIFTSHKEGYKVSCPDTNRYTISGLDTLLSPEISYLREIGVVDVAQIPKDDPEGWGGKLYVSVTIIR